MTAPPSPRKSLAALVAGPIVRLLARTGVTPNTLTVISFLGSAGAATLVVTDHLFAAGFVLLGASLFDILDGALARATNRVTRFGGVLDSTLDRMAEALMFVAIAVAFARDAAVVEVAAASLALIGSFLVSYVRARAEGAGIDCEVGILTRSERVILLALGLLLSSFHYVLLGVLGAIAVLSFVTAGQRLFHVWRQAKAQRGA